MRQRQRPFGGGGAIGAKGAGSAEEGLAGSLVEGGPAVLAHAGTAPLLAGLPRGRERAQDGHGLR